MWLPGRETARLDGGADLEAGAGVVGGGAARFDRRLNLQTRLLNRLHGAFLRVSVGEHVQGNCTERATRRHQYRLSLNTGFHRGYTDSTYDQRRVPNMTRRD